MVLFYFDLTVGQYDFQAIDPKEIDFDRFKPYPQVSQWIWKLGRFKYAAIDEDLSVVMQRLLTFLFRDLIDEPDHLTTQVFYWPKMHWRLLGSELSKNLKMNRQLMQEVIQSLPKVID